MDHPAMTGSSSRAYSATSRGAMQPSSSSADRAASSASNKRKRLAQGCVCDENDVIVDELQKIRGKVRESSHLAGNYARAIISIQHHSEPITSAREAKQLRNIGNYIANQIQSILQKHQSQSRNETTTVSTPARPSVVRERVVERRPSPARESIRAPPVVSASSGRRPYLPAPGKQPWYVLRVLKTERATSEQRAVALNVVLTKMQALGYDGSLAKLRVCVTSLLNTHQIVGKASTGGIFLTDRGIQSADFCVEEPAASRQTTEETASSIASPLAQDEITAHANNSHASERSSTSISASSSSSAFPIVDASTRMRTNATVCIELSDSEAEGYDSDTATIRATSLSPGKHAGRDDAEPDAEPNYYLSQRQVLATVNSADPQSTFISDSDEWEIVLILDHREVLSRRNRDILERKLLEVNVTCEVRSLNVGDVQWVARRYRRFESEEEFMLNVIVERKEVKDLSGSIIDRRYNEQKTRLRDSGMTHVIYLVEGSMTQQTTVRASGLQTALCRTQVQNQFFVQQCQNADESVAFLRGVHMNLLAKLPASMKCRNRERASMTRSKLSSSKDPTVNDWKQQFCQPIRSYTDFNAQFRKKSDFTVGEIYQMMLMQAHGMSSSRTAALTTQYPTFQHLAKAIQRREKLQDVRYGENQRRLGAKTHEFLKFFVESTDYEKDTPSVGGERGGRWLES